MSGSRISAKSRLASVTFARELLCLKRAGSILNIKSQRQYSEILIFGHKRILRKISSHAETPYAKFCSALSVRFKDIAEKQIPAKLKPIVDPTAPAWE